ncbi:MAG: DUF4469 domain-containing protein [Tannerellaceae bacterium]|jgi:hypothetical protein|nr:DUF4469 domain-containing protein [Tannerellaceae bacterium]
MAEEKNTVFVELYDLKLSDREDDRMGRVVTDKSLTEDDLIRLAVNRGTDINPETLRASIKILKEIAIREIANGASVQFGLGYFALDVKGVFVGDNAKWNPKVNSLHAKVTASAELRTAIQNVHVEVLGMASSGTVINSVTDVSSGEVNTRLTPGGGVNLEGTKIKIAGQDGRNGLMFLDANNIVYDVYPKSILVNDPKKISFIVPALPKGEYRLRLTTQYSTSSTLLKEPRTVEFGYPLTVK